MKSTYFIQKFYYCHSIVLAFFIVGAIAQNIKVTPTPPAKVPEVPAALTKANEAYAKQLFNEVRVDRAKGIFTQSEAQLSVPEIQKKVRKTNLLKLQRIQQEAFKKEQEFRNGYYVFYTAVPPQYHILQDVTIASFLRLLQDLTKALYKRVIQPLPELKGFYFLRYTFRDPNYSKYENVNQFLKEQITKTGLINDRDPAVGSLLLSTNLAFFGNQGVTGESTNNFLNNPQPWVDANPARLEACLTSFGYPTSYIDELMELTKIIKVDTGDLFQIFIPHTIVDKIAYLSWRVGLPFDTAIIRQLFPDGSKSAFEDIVQEYSVFEKLWLEQNPQTINIGKQFLENIDNGKYTLHKNRFLYTYIHEPQSLPSLNYYQARVLCSNKYLLNPLSGIKIYRYSMIERDKKKIYKEKLVAILDKMDAARAQAKEKLEAQKDLL